MERTITYAGDPNIGVFARVLEDIVIVPSGAPDEFRHAVKAALDAELVETSIQGSVIIGSLLTGNRKGIVVSGLASPEEIDALSEYREVMPLSGSMNAAGNVILTNDRVAFVHPEMEKEMVAEIGSFLGVKVMATALGGVKTVGMAGAATEKGVIVHPRTTDSEIERIAEFCGVPVGTGTINMGTGLIGTGLLVSTRGYLAGAQTSGFELGRIEDVFGFLE
ncbi:MAG: Translation initiation factor 6 [Methanoregula sp. PtaU1.Bin051]|nr:MAG: Translation initiation factor 6 [Methanoregula sp. PtaU1.Bin051]